MTSSFTQPQATVIKVLAADESRTSTTTATLITGCSIPVISGQKYLVDFEGVVEGGSGGYDLIPSYPSGTWNRSVGMNAQGNNALVCYTTGYATIGSSSIGGFGDYIRAFGVFTASTSGNMQITFAQRTSNATPTTIRAGFKLLVTLVS